MRILYLSHFMPYPAVGGASLRNFNIIKQLARTNDVHMVSFSRVYRHGEVEESRRGMSEHCKEVDVMPVPSELSSLKWYTLLAFNTFSRRPYSTWKFRTPEFLAAINNQLDRHKFDIIHVDTIALADYLRHFRGIPAVLNHHNVESTLLRRRADNEKNPIVKAYLTLQASKLLREESWAVSKYDGNICVSELDRDELARHTDRDRIAVIANGTDAEYFKGPASPADSTSLVFTGSMNWYPNRDAMILFAKEIWPLIKEKLPSVTMDCIGSHQPPEVKEVAGRDSNFKLHGFVDDIRPYVSKAAVYVVPIRIGGGTRLKILDAMSMGKAIVSHPIGAEGISFTDDSDIAIAAEPQEFAAKVLDLIQNVEKRRKLEANARVTAIEKYSWEKIVPKLDEFYRAVAKRQLANR